MPDDIDPVSLNRLPAVQRAELSPDEQAIFDATVTNQRSLAGLQGPAGIRLHSPRHPCLKWFIGARSPLPFALAGVENQVRSQNAT